MQKSHSRLFQTLLEVYPFLYSVRVVMVGAHVVLNAHIGLRAAKQQRYIERKQLNTQVWLNNTQSLGYNSLL